MSTASTPVLVTGATGRQGGATARALLAAGVPVRALVRDPARGSDIETLGAELVTGDLHDRDSLDRAVRGVRAVFSVQMPAMREDGVDFAGEVTQGTNLIEAALAAEVPQFVHTSVSGAGQHRSTPGWVEGSWGTLGPSLDAKAAIQTRLRSAGFTRWTLLKPGFFMDNFLPSMRYMFPRGIEGGLVGVIKPHTRLSLVATADIGAAAAAAILEPARFDRVELELASDYQPMFQIAEILSGVLGRTLSAPDMTEAEAVAAGMPPMGASLEWMNVAGQPARPEFARNLGIRVTPFRLWAESELSAVR